MSGSAGRGLRAVAVVSILLHLAGLPLAGVFLEPGMPARPLDQRLAYLAARPVGWTLGWAVWTAAALALVTFLAVVSRKRRAGLLDLSVMLAAGGACVDLLCNVIWAFVLPPLAAQVPPPTTGYLAFERGAQAGGLILANGLYSVAVLLASLSFPGRQAESRRVRGLGAATFAGGVVLALAGVTRDPTHLALATTGTVLAFCAWTLAVVGAVARGESEV